MAILNLQPVTTVTGKHLKIIRIVLMMKTAEMTMTTAEIASQNSLIY
jgi:hypothetical protein